MALKGKRTRADFLEWDKMQSLILKLERDNKSKFALLIAFGCYTGLRISDLLKLTWEDVLTSENIQLTEKKTGKLRTVQIHKELKEVIERHQANYTNRSSGFIFLNRYGIQPIRVQYINRELKKIASDYKLGIQFTSHSFRKSFGRRIWENNDHSEKALIILGHVFNHSSVQVTKVYLGIRDQEIANVYLNL